MFEKIVPVNKDLHANKRVKEITSFSFASKFHVAYVTLQEFTRAASIFPIVFLEDKQKDEFRPVVLLGLKSGVNVFVDAEGKWQASYIPAVIRRYPFTLTPGGADGQFIVCLDEDSNLVSETEGAALFDEEGKPTQVIENVKRYVHPRVLLVPGQTQYVHAIEPAGTGNQRRQGHRGLLCDQ